MRVSAPEFGPVAMIFLRVGIASLVLIPLVVFSGDVKSLAVKAVPLAMVGLLNSAFPFCMFAFAALSVTAGFSAMMNATAPMFGAVFAYFWLKDRLSMSRIAGLLIGTIGIIILVWDKISFKAGLGWSDTSLAVGAILLATCSYGLSANYTKVKLAGVKPLTVAAGSQFYSTLMLLPLAIGLWPTKSISTHAWTSVIALAVVCTALAYVLFFRLIAALGPSKAISVTFLIPVFGALWGFLFLNEGITLNMAIGCAVVLLGTALTTGLLSFDKKLS